MLEMGSGPHPQFPAGQTTVWSEISAFVDAPHRIHLVPLATPDYILYRGVQ